MSDGRYSYTYDNEGNLITRTDSQGTHQVLMACPRFLVRGL